MTTKAFREAILMAILPTAKPFTITSAMLQKKNLTLWTTNSCHFAKRGNWIGERANRKR